MDCGDGARSLRSLQPGKRLYLLPLAVSSEPLHIWRNLAREVVCLGTMKWSCPKALLDCAGLHALDRG